MKIKILSAFLIVIIGMIFAATTIAVNINVPTSGDVPMPARIDDIYGLFGILTKALGWVYTIFFVIAAFFILFAAFTYLTAKGDPEKVKGARDQIIYAVVAIVVALLAFSIDRIVKAFLV